MDNEDRIPIQRALDWFLETLDPDEWRSRKQVIEEHLESVLTPRTSREAATPAPLSIHTDKMGWYLYLAETALIDITKYEPTQGARVLPIFKRLGTDFEQLTQIGEIQSKRQQLLTVPSSDPDSGFFEILIALLWKKNGWPEVTLVPEAPPEKRPDIRANSETAEWSIECKRLVKSSDYSQNEREKWLRMWRQLSNHLLEKRMTIVLEIVFHVELENLPDEFLKEELAGKLPLILLPCTVISNDQLEVRVSAVDLGAIRRHLRNNFVKVPSTQLNELIAGYRDPNRGFTSAVGGRIVHIGGGHGNNRYLDTMDFAAGAFWHCDAERAIERKARDIRKRLSDAVSQLPDNVPSVVHIGLETLDGVEVEVERYQRIFNTMQRFDSRGKDLRWVYCHLYQSYDPPDTGWVIDETVYYFSYTDLIDDEPLSHTGSIIPRGHISDPGVHWLRDPP